MENCQVVINIPPREDLNKRIIDEKIFHLDPQRVTVNVWRLGADTNEFLDIRTLSLNTRPRRLENTPMAMLTVEEGVEAVSDVFHCQADSLQTFEFTCAESHCNVDFWQDRVQPALGGTIFSC